MLPYEAPYAWAFEPTDQVSYNLTCLLNERVLS